MPMQWGQQATLGASGSGSPIERFVVMQLSINEAFNCRDMSNNRRGLRAAVRDSVHRSRQPQNDLPPDKNCLGPYCEIGADAKKIR